MAAELGQLVTVARPHPQLLPRALDWGWANPKVGGMWVGGAAPEGQEYRWGGAQVREGYMWGRCARGAWITGNSGIGGGGVHVGEGTAPKCHQGPKELGPQ